MRNRSNKLEQDRPATVESCVPMQVAVEASLYIKSGNRNCMARHLKPTFIGRPPLATGRVRCPRSICAGALVRGCFDEPLALAGCLKIISTASNTLPPCLTGRITALTGCSKWPSSAAAASEEAQRTRGYAEPLSAARTKLADFFNILLGNRSGKNSTLSLSDWCRP